MTTTPIETENDAVEVLNPEGRFPCLLVCDHASSEVPDAYDNLGLSREQLAGHIGIDVGVAPLVRALSMLLDAPAILSRYSRLLIDTNRWIADPHSIRPESDGVRVPGNQNLGLCESRMRQENYFWPFHIAVHKAKTMLVARHANPVFLAIHSCTRQMHTGGYRPMSGGTIWHEAPDLAHKMIEALSIEPGLIVKDNEPYSGFGGTAFTIDYHTWGTGMPACGFEIVNDELTTPADQALWMRRLAYALDTIVRSHKQAA